MSGYSRVLVKYGLSYFRISIGVASLLSANFIGYIRLFPTPMRQLFDAAFITNHIASLGIAAGFAALVWRLVHWFYGVVSESLRSNGFLTRLPLIPDHWNPIVGTTVHWIISSVPAVMVFLYSHLDTEGYKSALNMAAVFAFIVVIVLVKILLDYFGDKTEQETIGKSSKLAQDLRRPLSLILLLAALFSYYIGTARMSYLLTQENSHIRLLPVSGYDAGPNGRSLTARIVGANSKGIFVAYYSGQFSELKVGVAFEYFPLDKVLSIQHGPENTSQ